MNVAEKTSPPPAQKPDRIFESAPTPWEALLAAVRFLTRVPLPATRRSTPEALRHGVIYFPLVGTFIGITTVLVIGAAALVWPIWLAVLLGMAADVWLTGALHEDAVADYCDCCGAWTPEQALSILKDSRIGSFGVLGLGIAVSLRYAATLAVLSQSAENWLHAALPIVVGAAIARWTMVWAMTCVPPVPGRASLAGSFGRTSWTMLVQSTLWALPAVGIFAVRMPLQFCFAVALLAIVTGLLLKHMQRRLGGLTGDCIGCLGYVAQVLVLLAAAARLEL